VLKGLDLRRELRAEFRGETKTEILAFDNQTAAEDGVDVIINRNNKTVAVERLVASEADVKSLGRWCGWRGLYSARTG